MQSVKGNGLKSFLKEKNDIILKDLLNDKQFQIVCWHRWLAKARFAKSQRDER